VSDISSVVLKPAPLFDENGRVWVVSSGDNQDALIRYYRNKTNNPFWNEHKLFLGG
jgi:hypothetical protein